MFDSISSGSGQLPVALVLVYGVLGALVAGYSLNLCQISSAVTSGSEQEVVKSRSVVTNQYLER